MTHPPSQWITEQLHSFDDHDVGSLVPPVFDAYARIFHPAIRVEPDGTAEPCAWNEVAKFNGRVVHPSMEWGSLLGTWGTNYRGVLHYQIPDRGTLTDATAKELARVLSKFTKSNSIVYALWDGYGAEVQNADVIDLPERRMLAIEKPIDAVANPFELELARTANLWWPIDNAWCVATEIDLLSTYVGGSHDCIQALIESSTLEGMPVKANQKITWDADTINPLPEHPLTHHVHNVGF